MSSGLALPGSLSITEATLTAVGTTMVKNVDFNVAEADRSSADGSSSFVYYIQATYDINANISYTASSSLDAKDDAYAMSAISIASASATSPLLSLPSASGVSVSAGLVSARDGTNSNAALGTFPVTLTVAISDQGLMTSSIAITGSDITGSNTDDATKAQVAYWSLDSTPTPSADTSDVLSDSVSTSDLTTEYSTQLATINGYYNNQSLISSWSISIDAITGSTNNVLAQHARYLNKAGQTALFGTGDKVITNAAYEYAVSITDYAGSAQSIASGDVYGVISQSA
jgi:hypothetical protein